MYRGRHRQTVKYSRPLAALAAVGLVSISSSAYAEQLSTDQIANVVSEANLPCVTGTAVALGESGGNSEAVSGTNDYGLFQINETYHPDLVNDGDWSSPLESARDAQEIYSDAGGWQPWVAYTNGSYETYLDDARRACGTTDSVEQVDRNESSSQSTESSDSTRQYTVQSGDTLSGIASQHDTSWQDIHQANEDKVDDPDVIFPDQALSIP